jgi:nucleolar GTP-binding protein
VGKSSLVRLLSSGTPLVANYPFTTRGVAMGHLVIPSPGGAGRRPVRCVLTDTPGVLLRPDEARNRMERLTLAALAYLPTAVMFVLDCTGGCGTGLEGQLAIRAELRSRFPGRPWLDVLSKWDIVPQHSAAAAAAAAALGGDGGGALRVSATSGEGVDELRVRLNGLLRLAAMETEAAERR